MNPLIAPATFQPRSLAIMNTLAMQGMKSVMVTIETATSAGESLPAARQIEQPGRAEVATEEADEERLAHAVGHAVRAREAEHVVDDGLARAVNEAEQMRGVEHEEERRTGEEERDRLLQVPLDARHRLRDDVLHHRLADRRHLEQKVALVAREHARGHEPDAEQRPDDDRRATPASPPATSAA